MLYISLVIAIVGGFGFVLGYMEYKHKKSNRKFVATHGSHRITEKIIEGITYYDLEAYSHIFDSWNRVKLHTDKEQAIIHRDKENKTYFAWIDRMVLDQKLSKVNGNIL